MYTNSQIDSTIESIISTTATGKDPNGRNKAISAYGVCARLPKAMADHFIALGGVGGKHGKTVPGVPALTQVVQHSLKRLMAAGKARHFYEDTTAMTFDIHGYHVVPSYPVMAIYQHIRPTVSAPSTPTPQLQTTAADTVSDMAALLDEMVASVHGAPKEQSPTLHVRPTPFRATLPTGS